MSDTAPASHNERPDFREDLQDSASTMRKEEEVNTIPGYEDDSVVPVDEGTPKAPQQITQRAEPFAFASLWSGFGIASHSRTSSTQNSSSSLRSLNDPNLPGSNISRQGMDFDRHQIKTKESNPALKTTIQHLPSNQMDNSATHYNSNSTKDYPVYPNQSFAVLQSQVHPTRPSPFLRTRNSHPSQGSLFRDTSPNTHGDVGRSTTGPGTRTAGNTPHSSPGLFSIRGPLGPPASQSAEAFLSTSPSLHPTHLLAPKTTNTAAVDYDTYSGNKHINNYEILDELGRGEHGKVKLGRDLNTGQYIAMKIVPRYSRTRTLGRLGAPEDKVKKEVAILKKARHPNVVSLLEVIDDPTRHKVYIVLEYVENGEIKWRSKGTKEIIAIEKKRLDRERQGLVDTPEMLDEDRRWVARMYRHREMAERRARSTGLRAVPAWSLEHGGESDVEEDLQEFDSLSRESSRRRDVDRSYTELDATGLFEGSTFGSYVSGSSRPRSMSIAESAVSHMSSEVNWDSEDEEMSYIPTLTLDEARSAFTDTLLGLEFLHFQGIIHRDIKPANLLVSSENRVKISDFGVSYLGRPIADEDYEQIKEEDATTLDDPRELARTVGTPAFYAPELCYTDPTQFEGGLDGTGPKITGALDVWALGVTLYGMVYGRLPFLTDPSGEMGFFTRICEGELFLPRRRLKPVEWTSDSKPSSQTHMHGVHNPHKRPAYELEYEDVPESLKDLLRHLLIKDPAKRMTIGEAKLHPWVLQGVDDPHRWVGDTDPKSYGGKRIEVNERDVSKAVVKANIIERTISTLSKVSAKILGRSNRAPSIASTIESNPSISSGGSTVGKDKRDLADRRTSLRGDEVITTALKASRQTEHPLSQSITSSPAAKEKSSYFSRGPDLAPPKSTGAALTPRSEGPGYVRPQAPDRSISTAESIKTIRPSSTFLELTSRDTNMFQNHEMKSTNSVALPSPSGRKVLGLARMELKSPTSEDSPLADTSPSDGSYHADATLGLSTASAAGEVQPPEVLQTEPFSPELPRSAISASFEDGTYPYHYNNIDSSSSAFARAEEINNRRQKLEIAAEEERAASRPHSQASNRGECPPSPDDEIYVQRSMDNPDYRRGMQNLPSTSTIASSSADDFTTMSHSNSHPSIPSIASQVSSLSGDANLPVPMKGYTGADLSPVPSFMRTGETITAHDKPPILVGKPLEGLGFQEHDFGNDSDDESEDEGLTFGPVRSHVSSRRPLTGD